MTTKREWHISHEATGTFIRTESGGLVCSLEAGSQDARDRHAALIAAAPELLEALKAVRDIVAADAQRAVDSINDGPEADGQLDGAVAYIQQVDDAIAKVEGR